MSPDRGMEWEDALRYTIGQTSERREIMPEYKCRYCGRVMAAREVLKIIVSVRGDVDFWCGCKGEDGSSRAEQCFNCGARYDKTLMTPMQIREDNIGGGLNIRTIWTCPRNECQNTISKYVKCEGCHTFVHAGGRGEVRNIIELEKHKFCRHCASFIKAPSVDSYKVGEDDIGELRSSLTSGKKLNKQFKLRVADEDLILGVKVELQETSEPYIVSNNAAVVESLMSAYKLGMIETYAFYRVGMEESHTIILVPRKEVYKGNYERLKDAIKQAIKLHFEK